MEIFSNVWNILTTENEMVTKIFTIPTIPIEAWLGLLIIISILKIDISKKQKFLYVFFLTIISLITKFIVPSPYNIIFNYLCMYVEIKLIFKTNIVKTILCAILPTIIFALLSTLSLNPTLKILNISTTELKFMPIYQLTHLFILYLLTIIFIYILKNIRLKLIIIDNINKHNTSIIVLNLIVGLITLITQAILTYYYLNILPLSITVINFILLLCYFSISFYSLNRIMKLQITTER